MACAKENKQWKQTKLLNNYPGASPSDALSSGTCTRLSRPCSLGIEATELASSWASKALEVVLLWWWRSLPALLRCRLELATCDPPAADPMPDRFSLTARASRIASTSGLSPAATLAS